ncbi:tetratricopeptide repeat protein [Luteimonas arsenica]|uniref:tetratricopeptide repeat protein n=1 Tax=Luteimonas arsenica TaxID=1586242 RepID=UPI001404A43C|nr:tetratricopeptide repeat protein [Luteimonas arsenica]
MQQVQGVWRFGAATLDERTGRLVVGGERIDLDRSCHDVLLALLRQAGAVVGKDELLEAGWPGRVVSENSLSKAVGRLRQALGADGQALRAIHGYGYRLALDAQYEPAPTDDPAHGDAPPREEGRVPAAPGPASRAQAAGRRRHLGIAAALVLGLLSTTLMYASAERARQAAEDAATRHQAMLDFVTRDILGQADPYRDGRTRPAATLETAIDNAADSAMHRLDEDPVAAAAVQHMLGTIRFGQDRYAEAAAAFERARALYRPLGKRHVDALVRAGTALCDVYRISNRLEEAEAVCATALAEARGGRDREALAQLKLAQLRSEQGRHAEALAILLPLHRDDAFVDAPRLSGELQWALGLAQRALGRHREAKQHFLALLEIAREGGERSTWTAWAYNSLGSVLVELGDYDRAETLLLAAHALFSENQGGDQVEAQMPQAWRAELRLRRGEWAQAAAILRGQIRAWEARLSPDHPLRLRAEADLAWAEAMSGDHRTAGERLQSALHGPGTQGDDRMAGLRSLRWARTAFALGDRTRAGDLLAGFDARHRGRLGAGHPLVTEADCLRSQWTRPDAVAQACGPGPASAQSAPTAASARAGTATEVAARGAEASR